MKSNIVDIDGAIHHITEKAILFSTDGVVFHAVWLPKSMIECDEELGVTSIQIPEQFAIDKELI